MRHDISTGRVQFVLRAVVAASLVVGLGGRASAFTITNNDDIEHVLTVFEGQDQRRITLKPEQRLESVCPKGCRVRIEGDDEDYQLESNDIVLIEDGYIYYEAQDEQPKPETDPAKQPKPPTKG